MRYTVPWLLGNKLTWVWSVTIFCCSRQIKIPLNDSSLNLCDVHPDQYLAVCQIFSRIPLLKYWFFTFRTCSLNSALYFFLNYLFVLLSGPACIMFFHFHEPSPVFRTNTFCFNHASFCQVIQHISTRESNIIAENWRLSLLKNIYPRNLPMV